MGRSALLVRFSCLVVVPIPLLTLKNVREEVKLALLKHYVRNVKHKKYTVRKKYWMPFARNLAFKKTVIN